MSEMRLEPYVPSGPSYANIPLRKLNFSKQTGISQIAFVSEQIVDEPDHRRKEFRSVVIRQPLFDDFAVVGSPFGHFCRHPDTSLLLQTHVWRVFPLRSLADLRCSALYTPWFGWFKSHLADPGHIYGVSPSGVVP